MRVFKFLLFAILVTTFACRETKKEKTAIQKPAVPHYYCKNKCENSHSEQQGNCKVCNEPLLHNQAYHAKDFLKNGPLNVESNIPNGQNNIQSSSPAMNQKGVYHYICNNGCPGGAGAADNCKSCGEKLVHNTTYHN